MARFCTHCGSRNEDDAAFCEHCGQPLENPQQAGNPAAIATAHAPNASMIARIGSKQGVC